jgi:hypothetical protein
MYIDFILYYIIYILPPLRPDRDIGGRQRPDQEHGHVPHLQTAFYTSIVRYFTEKTLFYEGCVCHFEAILRGKYRSKTSPCHVPPAQPALPTRCIAVCPVLWSDCVIFRIFACYKYHKLIFSGCCGGNRCQISAVRSCAMR